MGKQARHKGYVVGKVSKDSITLCSGLDVTFSIGTVDNIGRRKAVAIDVQAENLSEA